MPSIKAFFDNTELADSTAILAGGSDETFPTSKAVYDLLQALDLTAALDTATYDPATIAEQVVGLASVQTLQHKTLQDPILTASTPTIAQAICKAIGAPFTLGTSGTAVACGSDTTEDTLATVTVPANSLGNNGFVEIISLWSWSNNANTKTQRIRAGGISGTQYFNVANTTGTSAQSYQIIRNAGSTNSQKGWISGSNVCFTTSSNAGVISTIDTTAPWDIVITGQKGVSGDTMKLEGYIARVTYAP